MTIQEHLDIFRKTYGKEWGEFTHTPLYQGLMQLLEDCAPRRRSMAKTPAEMVTMGSVLFAQLEGYEEAVFFLRDAISNPGSHQELGEAKYKEE